MKTILSLVISYIYLILSYFKNCNGQSLNQTKILLSEVLQGYDPRLRPTLNQSLPTKVNVSFYILGLEDVDEVNMWFSLIGFLTLSWVDETIHWTPELYGGVDRLSFKTSEVWFPNLIITYPMEQFGFTYDDWIKVKIDYSGNAVFAPGTLFKSKCRIDVTYFPFDKQICYLGFISTIYKTKELQMSTPIPYLIKDHGYFNEHGEWSIVANWTFIASESDENYVIYALKLQRRPVYFIVNIICPIIVMSMLNVLIFVLPPQSGERVSFGITLLLAVAVFLTLVGETLPKVSLDMSILSSYLVICLFLAALMNILAILNLRIYFRDKIESYPLWAKVVIILTCSKRKLKTKDVGLTLEQTDVLCCSCNSKDHIKPIHVDTYTAEEGEEKSRITGRTPAECANDDNNDFTWQDISIMMDKLCLVFFFFLESGSTVALLFILTRERD